MKNVAYLVGQISPKFPITYNWRSELQELILNNDYLDIEVLNPCDNEWNKELLEEGKYAINGKDRSYGIDIIVPKDRLFVKRSTIGLVNLNAYDSEKPLLGSFFELAWYYDDPSKTVIAWSEDPYSYICQHPFVKKAITFFCKDHIDAYELLLRFFSGV
jgi:hypothetical protein